ncbi:MAG: hypothetical protein ACRD13_13320, partial [Terriglobales bacterium]
PSALCSHPNAHRCALRNPVRAPETPYNPGRRVKRLEGAVLLQRGSAVQPPNAGLRRCPAAPG